MLVGASGGAVAGRYYVNEISSRKYKESENIQNFKEKNSSGMTEEDREFAYWYESVPSIRGNDSQEVESYYGVGEKWGWL
ncbi:hypothetical protein [Mycoplasma suis]|nr:hypothetical protein [Mycoplasma suis]